MTSAFKIARNSTNEFSSSHHSLLKPASLSSFGPPSTASGATPPYGGHHAPLGPSPFSHEQLGGFHPSMLLNAQLALQVQAAAMAAALGGVSSAGTPPTGTPPISSIFSAGARTTPTTYTPSATPTVSE